MKKILRRLQVQYNLYEEIKIHNSLYVKKNNIKDVKVITQHVWAFIRFQTLNE